MNPITPTDWTNMFSQMNQATKRESLMLLRNLVRNAGEDVRRLGSEYIKDVRIRNSTSPEVARIVEHLQNETDERGIGGYISKAIAIDKEMVSEDIATSSWSNILKQVAKQVPSLMEHSDSLPNPNGRAGRRAKLYVTDICDVEALFNARANLYDPNGSEADAKTMARIIIEGNDFASVGIGQALQLAPMVQKMNHVLFPKWDIINGGMYYTFVTNHLIPTVTKMGLGEWKAVSHGRSIRRVA